MKSLLKYFSLQKVSVGVLIVAVGTALFLYQSNTRVTTAYEIAKLLFPTLQQGEQVRKILQDTFGTGRSEVMSVGSKEDAYQERVLVHEVVDGDTIKITTVSGRVESVRLIGINTPETGGPYRTKECFGNESTAAMKQRVLNKEVTLERDDTQGNRDKYERLLRYVFLGDENVNQSMIEGGYAYEYTYAKSYKYQQSFQIAERDARVHRRGIWNKCQQ